MFNDRYITTNQFNDTIINIDPLDVPGQTTFFWSGNVQGQPAYSSDVANSSAQLKCIRINIWTL